MAHDRDGRPVLTARAAGLVGCGTCGCVSDPDTEHCPRCGTVLHARRPASLEKTVAWLIAGLVSYIPANLYPMLQTEFLGHTVSSTIVGGVIDLAHHGSYLIAAVVFFASVIIPVGKFFAVGYLVYSIKYDVRLSRHVRTVLHEIVEFVGRWSMVDVFVVAILVALIHMGIIMSFRPGPAAFFFTLSVVFTMVSALALDPRLIWDQAEAQRDAHE